MTEEMVDIVDLDNRVIGTISKAEAHSQGLLHRTVIGRLTDSRGHWILVEQASHRQDAGQYVFPVGGHVKSGESELDALRREALEEIGISSFRSRRVGQVVYDRQVLGRHENHYFILYEINSDADIILNHEAVRLRRFTEAELVQEMKNNPEHFGAPFYTLIDAFYGHVRSS